MLILLALQSNSVGSVLTKDGTLGAEIRELKPGAAAPLCKLLFLQHLSYLAKKVTQLQFQLQNSKSNRLQFFHQPKFSVQGETAKHPIENAV